MSRVRPGQKKEKGKEKKKDGKKRKKIRLDSN